MSDWPEEGTKAPSFTLVADDGKKVKLSDFKGKFVVLYFYPKDDTPAAPKKPVTFAMHPQRLPKLGQWCWASVPMARHRTKSFAPSTR